MINPKEFYNTLIKNKIEFFAGVPDSLLKNICAYITANTPAERNVITANEGGAIALATGYHLATRNIPLVYMQNSGIGNAVNPLMSLTDKEVYAIPMILLIGWRGEPGIKDEPQHVKQGRVTTSLLDSMEIPYQIIDDSSDYKATIKKAVVTTKEISAPVAIVVRKGTFDSFKLDDFSVTKFELTREEALGEVLKYIPEKAIIVSTTGMLSRELFELREKQKQNHYNDFLTVGSMGHTSQIALGIALAQPEKQIFCFDGDGSAIMHLGNYAITGSLAPKNLKIIVFNNGAHDSVGGQPTIGQWINFHQLVESVGLKSLGVVTTSEEIKKAVIKMVNNNGLSFLDIMIKKGARKDLGRPTTTPVQNKSVLMEVLKK